VIINLSFTTKTLHAKVYKKDAANFSTATVVVVVVVVFVL
jgi:hypothetical protein